MITKPFLDSSSVVEDGAELGRRVERDGYLYLRGLIPPQVLENLRIQILRIAREAGWIQRGTSLEQGIANLDSFCVEPQPEYFEVYHRFYRLPDFHAMQHHPNLIGLFERFLGEEVLPHPRIIGRIIFPQREAFTTPAHQDFIPIQGTPDTYTAWFPLSDLPPEMGGLQISSGSHRKGVYDFRPALGAGGMEVTDNLEGTWVYNPFRQGDVLIFHSMAVHKGVACTSDKLRLSIDARFQKASEPVSPGTLEPHGGIPWAEVYEGWSTDDLKYYWKKWNLEVEPYDRQYFEKRDRLAFEMAESGDELARSTLQRIIARDPDAAKREKAEDLLEKLDAFERVS